MAAVALVSPANLGDPAGPRAVVPDGVLADLGVSSHQFDVPERGFSFRFDGPLDMRMNVKQELSASKLLNEYSEDDLYRVFREYGELTGLRQLVNAVMAKRSESSFESTFDLVDLYDGLGWHKQKRNRVLAQILRMLC